MACSTSEKKGRGRLVIHNITFGFGTKLAVMILNILIPRIFIVSFGSEVNGLLSTITQIFTYLALMEAGIGNASVNALYQPLEKKDYGHVNQVLGESIAYYRKVTHYYAAAVLGFALIYPFVAGTALDRKMIFMVIALQGLANCTSYYFSAPYVQLLIANGRNYWVEMISCMISMGTALAKIILVHCGFDVVAVQLGYVLVVLCKVPVICYVCRKHYTWLNPIRTVRYDSLKERSAFVVHEISSAIFSNTDIFIISTVCGFALSSVYSVYSLVFGALATMINTANAGLGFVLGQNYWKERTRFIKIYDCYSTFFALAIFSVMTVAYMLIIPFVKLYTAGVTDVNYTIPGLPFLFTVINIMSGSRAIAARLITVTGHAKNTQMHSVLESGINLVASVILVFFLGIHGVLIGTIIALLYRANDIVIYANKVILKRNPWAEYKGILSYSAVFAAIVYFWPRLGVEVSNYMELFGIAFVLTVCVVLIYGIVAIVIHIEDLPAWVVFLKRDKGLSEDS